MTRAKQVMTRDKQWEKNHLLSTTISLYLLQLEMAQFLTERSHSVYLQKHESNEPNQMILQKIKISVSIINFLSMIQ